MIGPIDLGNRFYDKGLMERVISFGSFDSFKTFLPLPHTNNAGTPPNIFGNPGVYSLPENPLVKDFSYPIPKQIFSGVTETIHQGPVMAQELITSMLPYNLPQDLIIQLLPVIETSGQQGHQEKKISAISHPHQMTQVAFDEFGRGNHPRFTTNDLSLLNTPQPFSDQENGMDLTVSKTVQPQMHRENTTKDDSFWAIFRRLHSMRDQLQASTPLHVPSSQDLSKKERIPSPIHLNNIAPIYLNPFQDQDPQPIIESTTKRENSEGKILKIKQNQKRRKSGFQAGVTVGYTYDAFFVSDGRSRKRRSLETEQPGKVAKTRATSLEDIQSPSRRTASLSLSDCGIGDDARSSVPSSVSPSIGGFESQSRVSSPPTVSSLVPLTPDHSLRNVQRFTCHDCGKHYATSSNLSRHKQTHRSLDSQLAKKCPHCGKLYVSMPALSMHILTHDLKHQCDICGKAFSRPWLLQGHRRAHTGEKPYGCAHCGRAFADRSNLRAHMQTHSVQKHFECGNCKKSFALKTYLTKHLELSCCGRLEGHDAATATATATTSYSYSSSSSSSTSSCTNTAVGESKPAQLLPLSIAALFGESSTNSCYL